MTLLNILEEYCCQELKRFREMRIVSIAFGLIIQNLSRALFETLDFQRTTEIFILGRRMKYAEFIIFLILKGSVIINLKKCKTKQKLILLVDF